MIIGLASPCVAATLDEGLSKIERLLSDASAQGAENEEAMLATRYAPERYQEFRAG